MSETSSRPAARFWADVWFVLVYELGEGVRTRSVLVLLTGYLMGVGFANWLFVQILKGAEAGVAASMGVAATERPGTLIGEITKSGELIDLFSTIVGSERSARMLLAEPVLALWAGAVTMGILPLLVTFNAAGSISQEVRSRSIRYLACRTGRLQIGLGKLLGQLAIGAVALFLGVALTLVMSQTLMVAVPPVELVTSLVDRSARAWVYTVPWAALAMSVGAMVPNPSGARVVMAGVMTAMHIGASLLVLYVNDSFVGRIADLARLLCANTAWPDFWSLEPDVLLSAGGRCLILAVAYFSLGHARFGTRDL